MPGRNNSSSALSSRVPKYVRIADDLRADIRRGQLTPGDRLPSFAETTERYQVAKHTVEKAHSLLEQEGLVRREQGRGVFVESINRVRTGNIGLLLRRANPTSTVMRELLGGIQDQVRSYNLNIMLLDENDTIADKKVDGLLICSNQLEVAMLDIPESLPRVLLMEPASVLDIANVAADDFDGQRQATRHLLELGHRRISFMVSTNYDPYALQRLAGYRAALDEFGVPFDENLCAYINGTPINFLLDSEDRMRHWLANGWKDLNSTAILAHNDMAAFAISKALGEHGLKVPYDVSLVGFDGVESLRHREVTLTTILVPFREAGIHGAQMLWEQIQKGGHESRRLTEPVQLQIGRTTRALEPGFVRS